MKILKPDRTKYLLILLTIVLFSCIESKRSLSSELLSKAQIIVEQYPENALLYLDSIQTPESDLDKDDYMQYIVTYTQAKYKAGHDITNDSLIFKAQNYFKNNPQKAGLANYVAGYVYFERKIDDRALESYLKAEYYARKTNDDLLIARSLHSIGNLYFIKQSMDSAIVRYKEANSYYIKTKGAEKNRLLLYQQIGRTYEDMHNLDSALVYFEKGSVLAMQLNDSDYETTFIFLKGMVLWEKEDYKQSEEYLYKALEETKNDEEALKIRLNLARLYIKIGKQDAAQFHIDEIKNGLSKINGNIGLRSVYTSLVDFYTLNADYKEAIYYEKLIGKINQQISEEKGLDKLVIAEERHQRYIVDKESAEARQKLITILGVVFGVALFLVFIAVLLLRNKRLKFEKELETNKLSESKDRLLRHSEESLLFLQSIHQNIIYDWAKVEEEIKELANEFGAEERPILLDKIQQIIDELRNKSNQQLIENARIHLREAGVKEQTIKNLNDKQLLIFILTCCGYNRNDMSIIMGSDVAIDDDDFAVQLKVLKAKLKRFGVSIDEMKQESPSKEMDS
ncbi:tetratricopeptide repeat protein [Dysgonomonas sp. ZJ279]|uniref:tetratricopeptide repeat protein n=1 Tax=Dysgonomonas sp. ZJ279 TaxID=2709796 RepID=UPI0013EDE692|nr:hypothetical protein [Dysgonomonas sp. ZJ279]